MNNIREAKNKLRKEIREKHKALTGEYYFKAGKAICDKVISRYIKTQMLYSVLSESEMSLIRKL